MRGVKQKLLVLPANQQLLDSARGRVHRSTGEVSMVKESNPETHRSGPDHNPSFGPMALNRPTLITNRKRSTHFGPKPQGEACGQSRGCYLAFGSSPHDEAADASSGPHSRPALRAQQFCFLDETLLCPHFAARTKATLINVAWWRTTMMEGWAR